VKRPGGIISCVELDSLAARLGLQAGDELLAINGHQVRDVIDVQFYGTEEWLELVVRRSEDGEEWLYETEQADGEPLGLDFVHPTFDVDIRRCRNNCKFCFLAQNPRGLRQSLYVKDDDYRYSFLHGNFVTLTNLTDKDWARLEEQRLSPLYVSVHATDPALRREMLQRPDAPDVLAQLRHLAAVGIEVHTQLVLVPGLNDGPHLERSLADLADLAFSPVMSVGVVPVGLTRHHRGPFRPYRPDEMTHVLEGIVPRQARFRREHGVGWVYPSDEWYLALGREVPLASEYDSFSQIENGVGMVRRFLDEWRDWRQIANCRLQIANHKSQIRKGRTSEAAGRAILVCGTLIAPLMMRLLDELAVLTGLQVEVLPVVNQFFGSSVTVSGLLVGQDTVALLKEHSLDGPVFLPRVMFDESSERTLDDWTLGAVQEALGVPVFVAKSLGEVVRQLAAGEGVVRELS
jgi:putative radical SAM enzyme (TIGR03279 family)